MVPQAGRNPHILPCKEGKLLLTFSQSDGIQASYLLNGEIHVLKRENFDGSLLKVKTNEQFLGLLWDANVKMKPNTDKPAESGFAIHGRGRGGWRGLLRRASGALRSIATFLDATADFFDLF